MIIKSIPLLLIPVLIMGGTMDNYQTDRLQSTAGVIEITAIGHASLQLRLADKVIHIDPVLREGDYATRPKADLILVTHDHFDHLDSDAINLVRTTATRLVYTAGCAARMPGGTVLANGATMDLGWIHIEAVPAYNIKHLRAPGQPFHPKGVGNGYVLTLGDKLIYIAGDTEDIPEMRELKNITIAFLPMNLPYTMTPEMVAGAARAFRPAILYPYHFGNSDLQQLVKLLADRPAIEVRLRDF
ncbi:MAG: MBL fold metallo-hydrolase [Candidatus Neomarinimicrobiota bacterium]